jgi:hypothetical protein
VVSHIASHRHTHIVLLLGLPSLAAASAASAASASFEQERTLDTHSWSEKNTPCCRCHCVPSHYMYLLVLACRWRTSLVCRRVYGTPHRASAAVSQAGPREDPAIHSSQASGRRPHAGAVLRRAASIERGRQAAGGRGNGRGHSQQQLCHRSRYECGLVWEQRSAGCCCCGGGGRGVGCSWWQRWRWRCATAAHDGREQKMNEGTTRCCIFSTAGTTQYLSTSSSLSTYSRHSSQR